MVLCRLQTKPDKRSLLPLINIRNLLPHRDRPSGTIPAKEGGLAIQGLHPLSFKIRLKLIALPYHEVFHASSSLFYIPALMRRVSTDLNMHSIFNIYIPSGRGRHFLYQSQLLS